MKNPPHIIIEVEDGLVTAVFSSAKNIVLDIADHDAVENEQQRYEVKALLDTAEKRRLPGRRKAGYYVLY